VAEGRVSRKLAAILAVDMVGYSRLMGADEEGTIARQKAHRTELIDPKIAEHNGRIVKTTGDGMLVEFASAVDAVLCAVEVQRAMAEREAAVPEDRRIAYRVGINIGDIVIDGDDILGDGVNIAARLEALAESGGICISRAVFAQIRNKVRLGFADLGLQTVKNIAEPVPTYRVLLDPADAGKLIAAKRRRLTHWRWAAATVAAVLVLAVAGVAWWRPSAPPVAPEKPSIAVLPFDNLSGDPEQDSFADGLSEDIRTSLAKLDKVLVIDRRSSSKYKGKAVKVQEVARDLNVTHVLDGSVQKSGSRLHITAQLVDGRTGGQKWAESYDREAVDIFAIKDEIVLKILPNLVADLTKDDSARVTAHGTKNLQAWLLYRDGMKHFRRSTKEDNIRARELFEAAIAIDKNYSEPYSGLSSVYSLEARMKWVDDPKAPLAKSAESVRKALELNPDNIAAKKSLAILHLYKEEYAEAVAVAERAVFLAPSDGGAVAVYGFVLQKANYAEKSVQQLERALRLDPFAPIWVVESLCESYVMAGRYEDALAQCQKAQQLKPKGPIAADIHLDLACAYDGLGRNDEAREETQKVIETYPKYTISFLRKWQKYRDLAYKEQWLGCLRRNGLPE